MTTNRDPGRRGARLRAWVSRRRAYSKGSEPGVDASGVDDPGTGAPAHPAFSAHFADPIYDDPGDELAPFGNDEGADDLAEWSQRRDELDANTTVRLLLEDGFDDPADVDHLIAELAGDERVDVAAAVVGAGFTLLRLTGRIDDEGRALVQRALERLEGFYGEQPQLTTMRVDLESWANRATR